MGRKGAWGGREPGADSKGSLPGVGAVGSMERKGVWGGGEYAAACHACLALMTPTASYISLALRRAMHAPRLVASSLAVTSQRPRIGADEVLQG